MITLDDIDPAVADALRNLRDNLREISPDIAEEVIGNVLQGIEDERNRAEQVEAMRFEQENGMVPEVVFTPESP